VPQITQQHPSSAKKKVMKGGGVLSRIKPIGFDADEGMKCLLYGRPGSGKTTVWSTFPKPILAIICSGGGKPGELKSIDTLENRKVIKQVVLEHCEEMDTLVPYLQESKDFATVVLDHATGFQDRMLADILDLEEIPAQKDWGLATQQDYQEVILKCKEVYRRLLNLKQNVVMIAQERDFEDKDSMASKVEDVYPTVGPATSPKLAEWLNPAVDYLCQTFIRERIVTETKKIPGTQGKTKVEHRRVPGEVDYCLRVGPHPVFMTKARIPHGLKTKLIVNPTYQKLLAAIRAE
jgi:hypothetical protein